MRTLKRQSTRGFNHDFFLTDNLKFLASTGLTSQAPLPRERSGKNDGDPDLRPERSFQNSFGLQQELLGGALRWQVIGYYNELFDLVVGREDRFQFLQGHLLLDHLIQRIMPMMARD